MKLIYILVWLLLISRPIFAVLYPQKSYYWGKSALHPQPKEKDLFFHRLLGIAGVVIITIVWVFRYLEPLLS